MPWLWLAALVWDVLPLAFPPVTFPFRNRFLIVLLSALVTPVVDTAIRMTEFAATVAAAVLETVMLRAIPGVLGSSPSIVTLSAPFNWITPNPVTGLPLTVIPGPDGWTLTEV